MWFYILREGDAFAKGDRLGPVGGLIITEVLARLIDADRASFRRSYPKWWPEKTLVELLAS